MIIGFRNKLFSFRFLEHQNGLMDDPEMHDYFENVSTYLFPELDHK